MNTNDFENKLAKFYSDNFSPTVEYFKRRTSGDNDDIQDLAQNALVKAYNFIKSKNISRDKWINVLNKIKNNLKVDTYRKPHREIGINEDISYPTGSQENFTDKLDNNNDRESIFSDDSDYLLRGVCMSKHRSLQEVLLIYLTPKYKELKDIIRTKFPFTARRYKEKGMRYEAVMKGENILEDDLNEMYCDFGRLIFDVANKLVINDEIGVQALKILLLSPNPWWDWYLLNKSSKQKDYPILIRDKDNQLKLARKKTIKRPYAHFVRDYMAADKKSLKKIKRFIEYKAKEKYPENIVSEEYIKKWYNIGALNSGILKKQKGGRKGKAGLKKKIDKYDKILSDIISGL